MLCQRGHLVISAVCARRFPFAVKAILNLSNSAEFTDIPVLCYITDCSHENDCLLIYSQEQQ